MAEQLRRCEFQDCEKLIINAPPLRKQRQIPNSFYVDQGAIVTPKSSSRQPAAEKKALMHNCSTGKKRCWCQMKMGTLFFGNWFLLIKSLIGKSTTKDFLQIYSLSDSASVN